MTAASGDSSRSGGARRLVDVAPFSRLGMSSFFIIKIWKGGNSSRIMPEVTGCQVSRIVGAGKNVYRIAFA